MSYTLVNDIADIDLTRHALIEASAGTGKTYTLENLVVRLLKERQDITIDNILMVTFTEKATSELKTRIQEKLLQEIRSAAFVRQKTFGPLPAGRINRLDLVGQFQQIQQGKTALIDLRQIGLKRNHHLFHQ